MLINYIRVATRNILKQRAYNVLNAIGLATGIACGLIIALYIKEELSYEKSFDNSDLIYRVHLDQWAKSSPTMGEEMKDYFPEIESMGRFAYFGSHVVNSDGNSPVACQGYFADSTVLDVFNFKLLQGDRKQVLATKGSIVITETLARKFFGTENPIGKTLNFNNSFDLTVNGVIQDLPENSHLKFDFVVPIKERDWGNSKGWMVMYTYARFKSDEAYMKAAERMPDFIRSFYKPEVDSQSELDKLVAEQAIRLQPVTSIHLTSNLEQEMGPNGSILNVYIFMAVELLILVVACANFMSLFTIQATRRMKEVGMRKILGAKPKQLMWQFFVEVILLTTFSLALAIVMYQLVLPFYNGLAGKPLDPWQIFERDNLMIVGMIVLVIVATSGLYPAIFIGRFKSASFLREGSLPRSFPNIVRNGLVVFQFAISAILISSTIIVHEQMKLLQDKQLGFDKDQVVYIKLYGQLYEQATKNTEAFKSEFLKDPHVTVVGSVSNFMGDDISVESIIPAGRESEEFPTVRALRVDEGYLTALNIQVLQGRNFGLQHHDTASYIINEAAVRALRLENPVGQIVSNSSVGNKTGTIVGVVKDYHFASLHSQIEPLVLEYKPEWTGYLTVKLKDGEIKETLGFLEETINRIAPNSLFVYTFLDQKLDGLYRSEQNLASVFRFFSVLAIVIACLGLISLSAYTVESRTKEIGVRKVLGATLSGLVALLSSRFFWFVLSAFVVAVPVTIYFMNSWLQNFAYQVAIEWWVFALTGVVIALLTVIVVGFHTVRAALVNPVRSLRYE